MANPDTDTPKLRSQLPGYTSIVAGHIYSAPGVGYVELARPTRHNSFHEELWAEFPRALRELDAHPATRVIVIAGQGKNFCAGIDVGYLQRNFLSVTGSSSDDGAGTAANTSGGSEAGAGAGTAGSSSHVGACPGEQRAGMRRGILALQDAYTEIERCRVPVIAAVHGRCIGGGVDLITACDLRICSEDASFCVKEVDLAIPADLGTLQRLPHIVGHGVAMDLALTARIVHAAEAQRVGLVSAVVPVTTARPSAEAGRPQETLSLSSAAAAAAAAADTSAPRGSGGAEARVGAAGGRAAVVAAAMKLGAAIAAKPALAVQGTKRVLLHTRDHPRVSDGLDYVATWNSAQLISRDLQLAMRRAAVGPAGPPPGAPRARL